MIEAEHSTKDMIRETAMDLFQKNSFAAVTVMDICKACGITKRTFYYHFDSKNDLLSGISNYWGIKAERLMPELVKENRNIDILWKLMHVYCAHAQKYGPDIIKQVYILMLDNSKDVHYPYDMYLYDLAVELVRKAQCAGEIQHAAGPDNITYILYHALRSISISWAAEGGTYDLAAEYRRSFDLIVGLPASEQSNSPIA